MFYSFNALLKLSLNPVSMQLSSIGSGAYNNHKKEIKYMNDNSWECLHDHFSSPLL